jgi:hypothetical protein
MTGKVDSSSHAGSLPVVGDSTSALPKPLEVSSIGAPAPDETRREYIELLDPQPNQKSVEGASSARTTEQESQSTGEEQTEAAAVQIGSETAIPQNHPPSDPSHTSFGSTYAGRARRLSQDTTSPTRAEGEAFKIEAPKSPVDDNRTVGWLRHILLDATYYYTRTMALGFPMSSNSFTLVTNLDLGKEGVLGSVEAEVADALQSLRSFTKQGAFDLLVYADSDSAGVKSESSGTSTPPTKTNLRWISHASRSVLAHPIEIEIEIEIANGVVSTTPVEGTEETERKNASTELAYWQYIENHPAHITLAQGAKEEAVHALTSHTGELIVTSPDEILIKTYFRLVIAPRPPCSQRVQARRV